MTTETITAPSGNVSLVTTFRPEPEAEVPAQRKPTPQVEALPGCSPLGLREATPAPKVSRTATLAIDGKLLGKMLPPLLKLTDSSGQRPVLATIAIDAHPDEDAIRMVVADGYRLAILTIPTHAAAAENVTGGLDTFREMTSETPFLLDGPHAAELGKAYKSRGKQYDAESFGVLHFTQTGADLIAGGIGPDRITPDYATQPGAFPNWEQLVPITEDHDVEPYVSVSPGYLQEVAALAKALAPARAVTMKTAGKTSPLTFETRAHGIGHLLVVLMPMQMKKGHPDS